MTPANLKRLVRILHQNVVAYEQEMGTIVLPEDSFQAEDGHVAEGQA